LRVHKRPCCGLWRPEGPAPRLNISAL
jgi:hypothetical protein